ncbi:hypothetical protein [Nocardioides zeae]
MIRVDPQPLEPAGTTYPDWRGTVAAEDSLITASNDLYDLAGLKHDDWTILALEIFTVSHGKEPNWDVRVYACNRSEHGVDSYEDLRRLEESGGVPVREILLHNVGLEDVVKSMKLVTFQLLRRDFENLVIVEKDDHPSQSDV